MTSPPAPAAMISNDPASTNIRPSGPMSPPPPVSAPAFGVLEARFVGPTVTISVFVRVGRGVVLVGVGVGVDVVGVVLGVLVGVVLGVVDVGVPVPTMRFSEGPPEGPGLQLYQAVPLTLSENGPPVNAIVPVAVGRTVMAMVGMGMGALGVTAVACTAVAAALTGALGIGLPVGVTAPSAMTVL